MQIILIFVIKFYRFVDINFVGYAKNYKLSVDEIENSKASSSWDLRIINKFWSMQSTNWGNDTCSKFKNARKNYKISLDEIENPKDCSSRDFRKQREEVRNSKMWIDRINEKL